MQEIGLSSMAVGPSNVACLVSSTIADVHIQFADVPVTPAVAFSIASTVDPLTAIYTKPVSVMSLMTAGGVVRLEVNRSVLQLTVESDTIKLKAA